MSLFGKKPEAAPIALPSPDGGVTPLDRGARIARRVIFQSEVGASDSLVTLVTRIATAKALGFTMFEIDVTPVKVAAPDDGGATANLSQNIFFQYIGGQREVIDGDEWKNTTDQRRKLVLSHVITVYALVVE